MTAPTFRPTADGAVSVPVDLLRDRSLLRVDVVVALALTADLSGREWDATANNDRLRQLTGLKNRAIQESLARLSLAGWVAVDHEGGGRSARRTVTLRWRLPDDFEDCRRPRLAGVRADLPGQRRLPFPAGNGIGKGGGS